MLTLPRRVAAPRRSPGPTTQRAWIEAALAAIPVSAPLVDDGHVPLYGLPHAVDWDAARPRTVRLEGRTIRRRRPRRRVEARLLRWLRRTRSTCSTEETHFYAAKAGVKVARVGVGDPSQRWGSCSESGHDPLQLAADPGARLRPPRDRRA